MPLPGAAKTVQPSSAQGAADWRSGPRWSILSVLCLVHPFASSRHFPSRGNERYKALDIVSHMTQKANPVTLLASPLGEEGHKVAKGVQANWIHRGAPRPANPVKRHPAKSVWTVVIQIMILDVDVTAEGGIIKFAAKTPPQPSEPSEPSEPSHRRCVQWCPPAPSSRAGLHVGMGDRQDPLS